METWKTQALLAALFAGLTSILAKSGMKHLSADLSLAIRTCVVAALVILNALFWTSAHPAAALGQARPRDFALLALSGLTTSLSWIFYYRAMKSGTVSFVALVDKGSIIVTLLLSFWLLKEPLTAKTAIGATLVIAGLVTLTYK
jgi:bacterial/archaeal transporter family protein